MTYFIKLKYQYLNLMVQCFFNRSIGQASKWISETVGSALMNTLEIGAFFLQFLDWFYSSGQTSSTLVKSLPIPPAPQV